MVSPWPAGGRRAGGRRARGPQVRALTSGAGPEAVTRGAGPRSFPARAGDSFKRRAGCAAGPERSPNGARVPRRTRSGAGAAGQVRRARSARSPPLCRPEEVLPRCGCGSPTLLPCPVPSQRLPRVPEPPGLRVLPAPGAAQCCQKVRERKQAELGVRGGRWDPGTWIDTRAGCRTGRRRLGAAATRGCREGGVLNGVSP